MTAEPGTPKRNAILLIVLLIAGVLCLFAVLGTLFIIFAVLPAVERTNRASNEMESMLRARNLGTAMTNYRVQHGNFPPATLVSTENPDAQHSWRIALLPYLELAEVHSLFDFNQPHDDPSNRKAIESRVDVFQSPRASTQTSGTAKFLAVVGEGTVFPPGGRSIKASQIVDGLTKTIMLIECQSSDIEWYQPDDLDVETAIEMIQRQEDTIVVFADGTPRKIPSSIPEEHLRSLLTRDGNEIVPQEYLPQYQ